MQIDKQMLNKILTMNDQQLSALIGQIALEAGIDPKTLGLDPHNIAGVRQALGGATEADLEQLNRIYGSYKGHGKHS